MDIDDPLHTPAPPPRHPGYTLHPTNALAGPSTPLPLPGLFLPPPDLPRPNPHFRSTDDLLSRFHLLSAYDRYVRPYAAPIPTQSVPSSFIDKGKGKERELPAKDPSTPSAISGQTQAATNDGDDDDSAQKGEKKWKNNYRHLIKGIPGKHSMKKDEYLMTMMQVPPKQQNKITAFDLKTQREAFSVSLEGLKGWNINVLVAESPQAREDRKKRKEMKRLAKAQHMAGITPTVTVAAAAVPAPTNTPGASGHPPVARSNTPRPGSGSVASRPGVPTPSQNNNPQARGSTPVGIGTPRSVSTPGGTATAAANASANSPGVPGSTSAPAQLGAQAVAPITLASATPSGTTVNGPDVKRGIKREREDSVNGTGVRPMNGNSQPAEAKPYAGAKPGMNGIRPRPVKKQRVDGGPVPIQQPTPHA